MKVKRRIAVVAVTAIVMGLTQLGTMAAEANTPVNGAAFTTVNENVDGSGHCKNGNPAVNCNIYDGKDFVWLNGGPSTAYVGDGDYFFAVLDPGGQADPNDGADKNLSDVSPSSGTGAGDAYTNRTFSVAGGVVSYSGTHDFDSNKIRLMGYDDTTNNGGVYIMAICSLADGYPVNASDCKYDAFKVKEGEGEVTEADAPTITKDADGTYDTTYTWDIEKSVDQTLVQQIGGTATFTYTVHVTHDAGTTDNFQVNGTIEVFNPNPANITGADVTDTLSDNTVCDVTDGADATLAPGDNEFPYTCSLSGLPAGQLDNTAEVTWDTQDVGGLPLTGGSADFTFTDISFANTNVDDCTDVTDPVPSGGTSNDNPFPTTVCVGDSDDGGAGTGTTDGFTFVYHTNYPVPTNGCVSYTNTAAESTSGNDDSVTVRVCGPVRTGALTIGFWKNTNGNGLISGYCLPGGGKTSLATYLSSLGPTDQGPFTGAAGKGCTALVTYVNGIISGANATNMNIMLRAQMLATALDVYFSDPNLGWTSTKVGTKKQPSVFLSGNSIGSFVMDLTAICPMIDNTTAGTAKCKLGLPSTDGYASGAFPWASRSVQGILDYESTVSSPFNGNATSPVWYAGVRKLQEIAKNTFDQINNQQAFGP